MTSVTRWREGSSWRAWPKDKQEEGEGERERESEAVSYLERWVDEEASVLLEVGFFRGIFVDDDLVFVIHLVGGNVRGQKLHAFRARPH